MNDTERKEKLFTVMNVKLLKDVIKCCDETKEKKVSLQKMDERKSYS